MSNSTESRKIFAQPHTCIAVIPTISHKQQAWIELESQKVYIKKKKLTVLVYEKCNRLRPWFSASIACANEATTIKALQLYQHITCIGSNSERLIGRFAHFIVQRNKRFLLFLVQQKISKGGRLENWVFCIRYFSKTKSKSTKKNTGQCLLTKTKLTCKNWDKSEKKKKRPKIRHRSVMLSALQLMYGAVRKSCRDSSNLLIGKG